VAVARCKRCGAPADTKQRYPHAHMPVPPSSHIYCAASNCSGLAMVWLTDEEEQEYLRGVRAFRVLRYRTVQVT
jgi:hypothetical protein